MTDSLDIEAIEARAHQWSISPRVRISCEIVEGDIPALIREVRRLRDALDNERGASIANYQRDGREG